MEAKVQNMLNVRGKTGNFSFLSLALKGLESEWRVWQQRPSRLAQLQKEMVGNTANLVRGKRQVQDSNSDTRKCHSPLCAVFGPDRSPSSGSIVPTAAWLE